MQEQSSEARNLAHGAGLTDRTVNWERRGIFCARFALGAAFLSGIADRFGLYTRRNVGYGNFAGFMDYTAKVNSFMPAFTIPFLAWAARCCWCCSELRWRFRLGSSRRWIIRCFRRRRARFCWRSMEIVRQLRERKWH
jgi:hypothetical protein